MSDKTDLRGLTIHQPWAYAIACAEKRIENRAWSYAPGYRGWLAIHAGAHRGSREDREHAIERVAELANLPIDIVMRGAEYRSAIIAVARLADVCSASLRIGWSSSPRCGCGPWAVNQQRHLILADVRPLVRSIPCKGALGLWRLPEDVDSAVRTQLTLERAS